MKKGNWVEWVGLWGSGKSTCINNYIKSHKNLDSKLCTSKDFVVKGKLKKIYLCFSSPPIFFLSLRIFFILIPSFSRACLSKNFLVISEFRSFLSSYIARISSSRRTDIDDILWEGEMHLLPILNLNHIAMTKVVELLLSVNQTRTNSIVFMKVEERVAFNRVLNDKEIGKNIRFKREHEFTIEHLREFNSNQKKLIRILKKKGIRVFESDGDVSSLRNFINPI